MALPTLPPSGGPGGFPFNSAGRPFSLTAQEPRVQLEDGLAGVQRALNQPRTPLLEAFFRVENTDVIQNRLRATIQKQTGYAIDRQSDTDLTVIMRKVFAEQARHQADVRAEVGRLNDIVLGVVVPMVATGVASYLAYLRDASRIPDPLPYGVQTSIKGTKSYELFRGL